MGLRLSEYLRLAEDAHCPLCGALLDPHNHFLTGKSHTRFSGFSRFLVDYGHPELVRRWIKIECLNCDQYWFLQVLSERARLIASEEIDDTEDQEEVTTPNEILSKKNYFEPVEPKCSLCTREVNSLVPKDPWDFILGSDWEICHECRKVCCVLCIMGGKICRKCYGKPVRQVTAA